jgi:hypothetical protein
MLQLLSSLLDWFAGPQGSNYLFACLSAALVAGMDGRLVAVVLVVVHLWLAFQ